jgi:type 1 glutamine amidotransferase
MLSRVRLALAAFTLVLTLPTLHAADPWLTIPGGDGPGKGKRIVLVSGDEEYRSEQTLTQLAKILARHHGFTCTVLYAIDPKDRTINPTVTTNIPGLEKLRNADLMVIFTRFRNLPDEQMKYVVEYIESGKPIVALRTATHAFQLSSPTYKKYTWNNKGTDYPGGFGKQVLGETWVAHHGKHGVQGTRGIIVEGQGKHPILRGIAPGSIFGTTDVYTVHLPLPGDSAPLVLGDVRYTLKPDSKAITGKKNDPMMPVAWTKTYKTASGKTARVFTTTMGAAQDFTYEGTRRMLVNACYWALGMEDQIPAKSDVAIVGEYHPLPFKFGGHKKGVRPEDLAK